MTNDQLLLFNLSILYLGPLSSKTLHKCIYTAQVKLYTVNNQLCFNDNSMHKSIKKYHTGIANVLFKVKFSPTTNSW